MKNRIILALFALASTCSVSHAAPKPSPLFGAGCVVARDKPLAIFGLSLLARLSATRVSRSGLCGRCLGYA